MSPRLLRRILIAVAILAVPILVYVAINTIRRLGDEADSARSLSAEPHQILNGIYLLGQCSPGAVYAVQSSDGLILIDTGIEPSAASVLRQLSELGLDVQTLRAIFLTHAHADHVLGAKKLRELTGAKIYAGKEEAQVLQAAGPREAFLSTYQMPNVSPHPTKVDVELGDDQVIEFGNIRVRAIAAPGHTTGSMCYLLEQKNIRALFTGDVIQSLTLANKDAVGTYAAYLPPIYRGDALEYLRTLKKLRNLPLPDLILPGHPSMDTPAANPHIELEKWNGLLDHGIALMEKLYSRHSADGKDFLDGNAKEILNGLYYLGDLKNYAVYARLTDNGLRLYDAPGGSGLNDFLKAALEKLGLSKQPIREVCLTSIAPDSIAGLADLVSKTKCRVIVAKDGVDTIRSKCPLGTAIQPIEQSDDEQILLRGRGKASCAYRFKMEGKTVLVSGNYPTKLGPQALIDLLRDMRTSVNGSALYRASLVALSKVPPDVWLPSVPVFGQNANIYDREWMEIIEKNYEAIP